IAALARVQALLSRAQPGTLTLSELVQMELAAQTIDGAANRVVIEGPDVSLTDKAAETFALALQELAANAAKHGALGNAVGRLSVKWRVRSDNWLMLEWRETAGAPLSSPDKMRRGYGRELIEVALPHALGARTTFELGPEGVSCIIELPDYATGPRSA